MAHPITRQIMAYVGGDPQAEQLVQQRLGSSLVKATRALRATAALDNHALWRRVGRDEIGFSVDSTVAPRLGVMVHEALEVLHRYPVSRSLLRDLATWRQKGSEVMIVDVAIAKREGYQSHDGDWTIAFPAKSPGGGAAIKLVTITLNHLRQSVNTCVNARGQRVCAQAPFAVRVFHELCHAWARVYGKHLLREKTEEDGVIGLGPDPFPFNENKLRRQMGLMKRVSHVSTRFPEGCRPDHPPMGEYLPLHDAANVGADGEVERLLSMRADVNALSPAGRATPLQLGVNYEYPRVVRALLDARADTEKVGTTFPSALVMAVHKSPCLVELLVNARANCNRDVALGEAPLFHAATKGCAQSALLLCGAGADVNGATTRASEQPVGLTPLYIAASEGHVPFLRVLIRFKADVNQRMEDGRTALHSAATADVVETLARAGADLDATTAAGLTPMELAQHDGRLEVVKAMRGQLVRPLLDQRILTETDPRLTSAVLRCA